MAGPEFAESRLRWEPLGGHNPVGVYGGNVHRYRLGDGAPPVLVDTGGTFGGLDADGKAIQVHRDLTQHFHNRLDTAHVPSDPAAGVVLTHSHGDHMATLAPMARLGFVIGDVYGAPFTLEMLRLDLIAYGLDPDDCGIVFNPVEPGDAFSAGGLDFTPYGAAHSTPGALSFLIEADGRKLFHSGDFKFDSSVRLGWTPDFDALAQVGEAGGVDLAIVDSSGARKPGRARTEAEIAATIGTLIDTHRENGAGRVIFTGYTHHHERLVTALAAAASRDLSVILHGRDAKAMVLAAQGAGIDIEAAIGTMPVEAGSAHAKRIEAAGPHALFIPGSQGEPGGLLQKALDGELSGFRFRPGDLVINLAKPWGSNAPRVDAMHQALRDQGATVLTTADAALDGGGHGHAEELAQLYGMIKPKTVAPTHTEARELDDHVALLKTFGLPALRVDNGAVVGIGERGARSIGSNMLRYVELPGPDDPIDPRDPLAAMRPVDQKAVFIPDYVPGKSKGNGKMPAGPKPPPDSPTPLL